MLHILVGSSNLPADQEDGDHLMLTGLKPVFLPLTFSRRGKEGPKQRSGNSCQ